VEYLTFGLVANPPDILGAEQRRVEVIDPTVDFDCSHIGLRLYVAGGGTLAPAAGVPETWSCSGYAPEI